MMSMNRHYCFQSLKSQKREVDTRNSLNMSEKLIEASIPLVNTMASSTLDGD